MVQGSEAGQNSLLRWEALRRVGTGSGRGLVGGVCGGILRCSEDVVFRFCERDARLGGKQEETVLQRAGHGLVLGSCNPLRGK